MNLVKLKVSHPTIWGQDGPARIELHNWLPHLGQYNPLPFLVIEVQNNELQVALSSFNKVPHTTLTGKAGLLP